MQPRSALVLFSAGQDSTLCLADALNRFDIVETVGFSYGQRHHIEMQCRTPVIAGLRHLASDRGWPGHLGDDHILDIPAFAQIGGTALTDDSAITWSKSGLPSTFVPGRNIVFLTYAAALAYRRGLGTLVGGMCETDYSGYPDCRRQTLDALATALQLGMDREIIIDTPLMHMDKAASWALAHSLGGQALVDLIIEETHSCYMGDRQHRFDWGYGCNGCPACELRASGFYKWMAR